jgi:hypothetical protein
MFLTLSIIDKDRVNMYLNQEDKEDKEVILEAYQALISKCSNPSFFIKSLINELLTNKKVNKQCNEHTIINDADIDLYLILGIQNVSSDELFKPRNHLIKMLKDQFKNENDDNTINDRVMSSIMGNLIPYLVDTTSLETKCKLSSLLENHSTIVKHKLDNDKNPNTLIEKFEETQPTKLQELEELINQGQYIIDFINSIIEQDTEFEIIPEHSKLIDYNNELQDKLIFAKELTAQESITVQEIDNSNIIDNLETNIKNIKDDPDYKELKSKTDLIYDILEGMSLFCSELNDKVKILTINNIDWLNEIQDSVTKMNIDFENAGGCSNHKKFCDDYFNDINKYNNDYITEFNNIIKIYLDNDKITTILFTQTQYSINEIIDLINKDDKEIINIINTELIKLYTIEISALTIIKDKFGKENRNSFLTSTGFDKLTETITTLDESINNEKFQNKYMRAINPSILKPYQIALIVIGSIIVMVIIGFLIKHILKRKRTHPSLENKSFPHNISYKTPMNNKSPMINKSPNNNKSPSNTKPFNNISHKKIL